MFSADGRFLHAPERDGLGGPFGYVDAVGPEGAVYTTVREPYPQIRRYRVGITTAER